MRFHATVTQELDAWHQCLGVAVSEAGVAAGNHHHGHYHDHNHDRDHTHEARSALNEVGGRSGGRSRWTAGAVNATAVPTAAKLKECMYRADLNRDYRLNKCYSGRLVLSIYFLFVREWLSYFPGQQVRAHIGLFTRTKNPKFNVLSLFVFSSLSFFSFLFFLAVDGSSAGRAGQGYQGMDHGPVFLSWLARPDGARVGADSAGNEPDERWRSRGGGGTQDQEEDKPYPPLRPLAYGTLRADACRYPRPPRALLCALERGAAPAAPRQRRRHCAGLRRGRAAAGLGGLVEVVVELRRRERSLIPRSGLNVRNSVVGRSGPTRSM